MRWWEKRKCKAHLDKLFNTYSITPSPPHIDGVRHPADTVAELGLGADLAVPGLEILVQIVDDDAAAFVTDGPALLGRMAANLIFDGV